MSLTDEVRAELRSLAQAYIDETCSISDILTLETEYCDLDLDIDDALRNQLASLSLFGNEYCFDARPLDDFEQVIYEILDTEPPAPILTIEREARVLARACLDNITTPDLLIKFERRCQAEKPLADPLRDQLATIAARAQDVEDQKRPRADLNLELRRLLSEAPSPATSEAAAS